MRYNKHTNTQRNYNSFTKDNSNVKKSGLEIGQKEKSQIDSNHKEAFIKRLQKKLVKNHLESAGINNSKNTIQTVPEILNKGQITKLAYVANKKPLTQEKKLSTFRSYLLKDLCEALDSSQASTNRIAPKREVINLFIYKLR